MYAPVNSKVLLKVHQPNISFTIIKAASKQLFIMNVEKNTNLLWYSYFHWNWSQYILVFPYLKLIHCQLHWSVIVYVCVCLSLLLTNYCDIKIWRFICLKLWSRYGQIRNYENLYMWFWFRRIVQIYYFSQNCSWSANKKRLLVLRGKRALTKIWNEVRS